MSHRKLATLSLAAWLCAGLALAQNSSTTTPAPTAPPSQAASRRTSPAGTAATEVGGSWSAPDADGERRYSGGKWIEITYSRPILRNRPSIFGKGAEYGKTVNSGGPVWRTGANATTRMKTEAALEIGGKRLDPGEYSLFVDLKENGWTLIVSKQPFQEKYDPNEKTKTWGSYNYDPKQDVVRVPMTMMKPKVSVDQFTIGFADVTDQSGKLAMAWDGEAAVVPFRVVS